MSRGFDWRRAKPRRPSISIVDEKDPEPYRRPFVRRVGPRLSKEEQRALAADAVREFEQRDAARGPAAPQNMRPPWEE